MSLSGDIHDAVASAAAGSSAAPSAATPSTGPSSGGASPTPSPAPAAGSAAPSIATDAAPASATATPSPSSPASAEPPRERWNDILANAREKATKEAEQRVLSQFGGLKPEQIRDFRTHLEYINRFGIQQYYKVLGAQLEASGQSPHPSTPPPEDLEAQDGTRAYSATAVRALLQQQAQQIQQQIAQRLAPLEQSFQSTQAQQVQSSAQQWAQAKIAEASQWEGWSDLKPHVLVLMKDGRRTLESAYLTAYQQHYIPTRNAKSRQAVLDELKAQPASTAVAPSTPVTGAMSGPMTSRERIRKAIAFAQAKHSATG